MKEKRGVGKRGVGEERKEGKEGSVRENEQKVAGSRWQIARKKLRTGTGKNMLLSSASSISSTSSMGTSVLNNEKFLWGLRGRFFQKEPPGIPLDFSFTTSDKSLEMGYNTGMNTAAACKQISTSPGYESPGRPGNYTRYSHHAGSGPSMEDYDTGNYTTSYTGSSTDISTSSTSRTKADSLIDTYYIYSFDGKLLAEYDENGNCITDYIYFGNRLLAEYKPQSNEYFYYMTDQINSTRIITDGTGNVVYSQASGPYGDVQKTWTETYDPKLKFSGKEREGYSGLDYFGARYYDHKSYRFNSVDPIINKDGALSNPQLWNLYSYCRNNPISHLDPDGRRIIIAQGQFHNEIQNAVNLGRITQSGQTLFQTLDSDPRIITLRGGTIAVQNNAAICGQKTNNTVSGGFIDSVEFTIDFSNINNYHTDKSGVTTVWHELFHASAYMQSNSNTGITWVQAIGLAWRQDQPIPGGQGTGTQRGTAGQFGAKVAQEVAISMINISLF